MMTERPSAETQTPYVIALRRKLVKNQILVERDGFLVFTMDAEFDSPSAAAAVIHGGSANGLSAWKDSAGKTLKQLEEG